jgi:hypothetical protein
MVNSLADVQSEIDEKLQHGFDTRDIYKMFGTFVTTITQQTTQITEMKEAAERSEAIIEHLGTSLRDMEVHVQGFATFTYPGIENDDEDEEGEEEEEEDGSIRARKVSIREEATMIEDASTTPTVEPVVESVPGTPVESPRVVGKQNQWEDSPAKKTEDEQTVTSEEVPTEKVTVEKDTEASSTVPSSTVEPPKSATKRKKSKPANSPKNSDPNWKFKKRRIVRQVSAKLLDKGSVSLDGPKKDLLPPVAGKCNGSFIS